MQVAEYLEKTLLGGVAREQLDFVADGEGHRTAHEVNLHHIVGDVLNGKFCLAGNVFILSHIIERSVAEILVGRLELHVLRVGQLIGHVLNNTFYIRPCARDFLQRTAPEALNDDRHIIIVARQIQNSYDSGKYADGMYVLERRNLYFLLLLAEHTEQCFGFLFQTLHEIQALLSANQNRGDNGREEHEVPGDQDGIFAVFSSLKKFSYFSFVVGNHRKRSVIWVLVHIIL